MVDRPDQPDEGGGGRFTYFMIRIHAREGEEGIPSGIVERLGSGRKHAFSGVDELVRLLTHRPGSLNM